MSIRGTHKGRSYDDDPKLTLFNGLKVELGLDFAFVNDNVFTK